MNEIETHIETPHTEWVLSENDYIELIELELKELLSHFDEDFCSPMYRMEEPKNLLSDELFEVE